MNTLNRGLIILVSVVFLAVVSIGGAQAGNTINTTKGIKSNGDNATQATTVQSSTSNSSDREGTTVKGPKDNKGTGAERGITIKTPWPPDKKNKRVYTPPKIKKDDNKSSERGSGDPLKGLNVTKSKPAK